MALDTQAPAWLQRQWAPRETFDPTPWLQDRYARQIDAQVIPLKIQGMQLQNQAQELHIANQAMQNEEVSRQMAEYKEQLPRFNSAVQAAAGSPETILDTMPDVTNPALVSQWRDLQLTAANTLAGNAAKEREIQWMRSIAEGNRLGVFPPTTGPDGGPIDEETRQTYMEKIQNAIDAREEKKLLMQYGYHYLTTSGQPEVIDVEGNKFVRDPKSGTLHPLKSTAEKIPVSEQEDKRYARLRRQESVFKALVKSNPNRPDIQSELKSVQDELQAWEVRHGATEETIETTPGGGISIRRGKAGPAATPEVLTTQNLSKAQDSLNQSVMTIEAADRLLPMISSETMGPRAFAESWVKDRFLANLYPELASQKRITAERFAAEMRSSAIRELRSDGNISEKERQQILQAVPEINDPIDSPARARDLIKASQLTAAIRAMVTSQRMKTNPNPVVLKAIPDDELLRIYRSGLIRMEDTDLLRWQNAGLISPERAQALWKIKRQL